MAKEGEKMRIKYSLLPKLRNLTNREMDFFLCIARYQDLSGKVIGVHNQDICRKTGMCKQTFYTVMRSLKEKGIVSINKQTDADYDLLILGNDFSYEGAFREGYVNLHRQIFHRKQFCELKANEKYLLFEFLKRTHENSSSYHIKTENFYNLYADALSVTKRVIRGYLHSLRTFFAVGIKGGQYWITFRKSVFGEMENKGVEEQEFEYFVQVNCRRNRMEGSEEGIRETAKLLKQYRPRYIDMGAGFSRLKEDLAACIRSCAERGGVLLSAAYIHNLLKDTMEKTF